MTQPPASNLPLPPTLRSNVMTRPSTAPPSKHLREPSFGEFRSSSPSPSQGSDFSAGLGNQPQPPSTGANAGHELGEHDLLGSFEDLHDALNSGLRDAGPSIQRQPEIRDAHHNHSADLINLLTDEESGEVKPLPGDPHLELYSGPDATLPGGGGGNQGLGGPSTTTTRTDPYPTVTSSPHHYSHAAPRHPPRRLSTIDIKPSSLPALSPEVGDSFIYRATAPKHDEHGQAEDAEQGMRRLSISPTRTLSHLLPKSGRVGTFPTKRKEKRLERTRSLDKREERDEGEGRQAGGHEKAATSPAMFQETASDSLLHEEDDSTTGGILGKSWSKKGQLAATIGGKAAQEIKSKWKTVVGPGTFTPSARDLFGSPSGSGGSFGFSQKELDAPSAVAMPVETSHHTPFTRRSMDPFGPFASSAPSGSGSRSYIPPSGAPGFARDNGWVQHEKEKVGGEWSGTRLVGRREGTVGVLDDWAADALRPSLPARQRLSSKWTLLFSIDQHGASLSTFYRVIENYSHTHPQAGNLLIIRDSNNRRFGVFMNEWIRRVEGSYTGSGESWLFRLVGEDINVRADVFRWTGKNQYFALCESGFISFGGGDGKYGLYLDAAFMQGSSARCPAYDNEVLCAKEGSELEKGRFECMGMEVWATG